MSPGEENGRGMLSRKTLTRYKARPRQTVRSKRPSLLQGRRRGLSRRDTSSGNVYQNPVTATAALRQAVPFDSTRLLSGFLRTGREGLSALLAREDHRRTRVRSRSDIPWHLRSGALVDNACPTASQIRSSAGTAGVCVSVRRYPTAHGPRPLPRRKKAGCGAPVTSDWSLSSLVVRVVLPGDVVCRVGEVEQEDWDPEPWTLCSEPGVRFLWPFKTHPPGRRPHPNCRVSEY